MMKKILLLILVFFCLSFNLTAQTPPYYIIGENEFSNTNIYSLHFQETTNTLYATTDRGVYCYKQNKFRPIASSKNQFGNSLFSLVENSAGKLLCCNLSGQVFEIKENKLLLYFELPKNENTKNCKLFFDKKDNLIMFTDFSIRSISSDKTVSIIKTKENGFYNSEDKILVNQSTQLPDGKILFRLWDTDKWYIYDKKITFLIQLAGIENNYRLFQLGGDIYYGSDQLRKIHDTNYFKDLSLSAKSIIYQENNKEVFCISPEEGFYTIRQKNNRIEKETLGFNNYLLSAITQNNQGTVFLGTFKNGVTVIPNRRVSKYFNRNHFKGIVADPQTNLVHLSDIKENIYEHKDSLTYLNHFNLSLDQLFFVNGNYKLNHYRFNKFIIQPKKNEFILNVANNIKDLHEHKKDFFCYISSGAVYIVLSDSNKINNPDFAKRLESNFYIIQLKNRGKSIYYHEFDNSLYYATTKGLFAKEWNTAIERTILYHNKPILVNDFSAYNEHFIIGTEKNGLLLYSNKKIQSLINLNKGLKSQSVKKIKVQDDLLFIQTSLGFQTFDLISNQFIGLGDREGVASNAIYDFTLTHDQLWLLEKNGYSSLKLKNIGQNEEIELPELYLDSILVNNKRSTNEYLFSFDENNVKFYFDYRSFETLRDARYYYRLNGVANEWKIVKTTNNLVEYRALSPGNYEFEIKVVYRNLESNILRYEFTIQQPFWFQLWFIALCFLVVTLLISILFYFRIKRNKKERKILLDKQKMQSDIFESKLKAIRSQMNPHFIFNSLNSIQSLVLKENKELSYDSIEQFSELVRKTLQFSEKNFVPIKEELSFLQIYMELESLRMKSDFSFTLKNEYSHNINIPSLLIQPFIENSIHHGLLHKEGEKNLDITFYKENNETYCSIVDNGIGREEARVINNRQNNTHQSFSLSAMKDRLRILSQQHGVEFNYKITDLYNELNQPIGTKVVVHFPFQDEY